MCVLSQHSGLFVRRTQHFWFPALLGWDRGRLCTPKMFLFGERLDFALFVSFLSFHWCWELAGSLGGWVYSPPLVVQEALFVKKAAPSQKSLLALLLHSTLVSEVGRDHFLRAFVVPVENKKRWTPQVWGTTRASLQFSFGLRTAVKTVKWEEVSFSLWQLPPYLLPACFADVFSLRSFLLMWSCQTIVYSHDFPPPYAIVALKTMFLKK